MQFSAVVISSAFESDHIADMSLQSFQPRELTNQNATFSFIMFWTANRSRLAIICCCDKAAATRATFLLIHATEHFFFMLQRLWIKNVACVARDKLFTALNFLQPVTNYLR